MRSRASLSLSLCDECCAGDRNAPVFPRERRAEESIAPRAGTGQIGPVLVLSAVPCLLLKKSRSQSHHSSRKGAELLFLRTRWTRDWRSQRERDARSSLTLSLFLFLFLSLSHTHTRERERERERERRERERERERETEGGVNLSRTAPKISVYLNIRNISLSLLNTHVCKGK